MAGRRVAGDDCSGSAGRQVAFRQPTRAQGAQKICELLTDQIRLQSTAIVRGGIFMKKIGIMLFLLTLAVGLVVSNLFSFGKATEGLFNFSFNFKGVKGAGHTAVETRDLTGFRAVDVGGIFNVEITAQKGFGVEIEADDNLIGLVRTEVRDGVLYIKTEEKISPRSKLRIRISAPDLDRLDVSGAAKVNVTGLKSSEFTLDSSGASKITLAGESTKLNVDVSGATKIDAGNLIAENASVDASGASRVMVNVSGELRAEASGASKISYTGSPKNVIEKSSGAGKVSAQ